MVFGDGWTGHLNSANQIGAAAIFVGAGVVVVWMFGREHADRTFASLFALPVSKGSIAVAKLMLLLAWAVMLSTAMSVVALLLGVAGSTVGWVPLNSPVVSAHNNRSRSRTPTRPASEIGTHGAVFLASLDRPANDRVTLPDLDLIEVIPVKERAGTTEVVSVVVRRVVGRKRFDRSRSPIRSIGDNPGEKCRGNAMTAVWRSDYEAGDPITSSGSTPSSGLKRWA